MNEPSYECNVHITEDAEEREGEEDFSIACHEVPFGSFEAGEFILQQARYQNFSKTLSEWKSENWRIFMFFNNEGEIERYNELTKDSDTSVSANYPITILGSIQNGFIVPSAKLAVLSSAEIFGRYESSRPRKSFNREKHAVLEVRKKYSFKSAVYLHFSLDARPIEWSTFFWVRNIF